MRTTFRVYERLKKEQHINALFQSGKALSVFPVRFIYRIVDIDNPQSPLQVGFSAPKKKFRRAFQRNRVRRLLTEAWRLNKQALIDAIPAGSQMHVFIIFTGKEMPDYTQVAVAVKSGIDKLIEVSQADKLASEP